ncbi:hypothetical protein BT96DRAFT_917126 [Gymnopus androsaceus JB14]|uniref:MYND-type domain-containing protein n=1 Tax=Gymnopus androsaceus JB14 TaxID=1447944 RepID=A0A6A4I0A4_9AGAR|nr:hypothetical protein BT96DRAFT_917126 [Gymnopus androsaceus JB14]
MGRVVINQGSLNIAYGSDHATGYFLSVSDTRLQHRSGAPAEVNEIAGLVEEKQGYGGYFDLHTGPVGFGFKATLETLVYYWGVYGVPKNDIERARRGLEVPGPATTDQDYYKSRISQNPPPTQPSGKNLCLACGTPTTRRCTNCGAFWACGPEHAKQAWSKHKPECMKKAQVSPKLAAASTPTPTPLKSQYPIERIKGYLFKEDATEPRLVDVEVEKRPPEDADPAWDYARAGIRNLFQVGESFLLGNSTFTSSGDIWIWGAGSPQLVLTYADDFAINSQHKPNKCVEKLTKGKMAHKWAGPLMLMKYPQHSVERFGDVDSKDLESAIKFFNTYGS